MKSVIVYGDGVHDDTDAMQAILDGEAEGITPNGLPWNQDGSVMRLTRTLELGRDASTVSDRHDA
jgi:hypothetical protein